FGSGEGHWQQHWLHDQPGSLFVAQDDWDHPNLDNWLLRLEGSLEEAGEAYLVAHSLGCLLAARLAGRSAARRVKRDMTGMQVFRGRQIAWSHEQR
ncbi:RBBP9/YdeN family alpha/beta hydrolase, partial [Rhizobium ruizarguesonis]